MTPLNSSSDTFRYDGFTVDPAVGLLRCTYRVADWTFVETIRLAARGTWSSAAWQAARLVYLLAGISYYKTLAPTIIDLGDTPVLPGEAEFLRSFYTEGLGEFAFRNQLDLHGLSVRGGATGRPASAEPRTDGRLLVPFGGGLDSIVTVELVRETTPDSALFILSPTNDRFEAIERAAQVTGLPIVRAERSIDPKVLRPVEHGFLQGHVPVTGILSAIAVLATPLVDGRGFVVMSNERSASSGNVVTPKGTVNHQWSKSLKFEEEFSKLLKSSIGPQLKYFSLLRPFTELWIAEQFHRATQYHQAFRSCNRAFYLDQSKRLDRWCGVCDKCCFIDLILAPFLSAQELGTIFDGREPLENPTLLDNFRTLLGVSPDLKPWECVGDVDECRAAAVLTAERPDRRQSHVLISLLRDLGEGAERARQTVPVLLEPFGAHHIPNGFLPAHSLV